MRPFSSILVAFALLASCNTAPDAAVTDASVRLPAVKGNPGAAYFTLHGGEKDRTLVKITSPVVGNAEMHDMKTENGMAMMVPIEGGLPVPKGATISFQSGGKHVMLYNIKPDLKAGDTINLTFEFADGSKETAPAKAIAAGGEAEHSH